MAKAFKDWDIQDIIAYCKANKEIDWLKATASKQVPTKVYPRKKVQKLNADGTPAINAKGKPVMVSVADKDAKPVIEMRPITFVQIKSEFAEKFGFKAEAKAAKPTMYDIIAAL
ncbi:MAG: hypothetical protein IKT32_02625 [Clostridia bacterium]|nr:hypothetical protein [Clostridia bacterium]